MSLSWQGSLSDDPGDLPANRILRTVRALGVTALEVPAAVLGG